MPFFKVTLTARDGLTADQISKLVESFTAKCNHAYLVHELGEAGSNSHLEGVLEWSTNKTSNVTRAIRTLYNSIEIEVNQPYTIMVKSVYSLQGCLSYASKELNEKGTVVLLQGWEESWIKQKTNSVAMNKAPKTLKQIGQWIGKRIGPAQIYTWCEANNRRITNLREYREVCVSMAENQYMFDRGIHKSPYANVMALFKDGRGVGEVIDDECRFLMLH